MFTLLLLIGLVAIMLTGYQHTGKYIVSPVVVVSIAFILSVLLGFTQYSQWDFSLSPKTFLLVFGGISAFALGCVFIHTISTSRSNQFDTVKVKAELNYDESHKLFSNKFYAGMLIFQGISGIYLYRHFKEVLGSYGLSSDSFANVLSNSNYLAKFSGEGYGSLLSGMSSILYFIIVVFAFVSGYCIVRLIVLKKRPSILLIINFLFSSVFPLVSGGRLLTIQIFAGFLFLLLFELQKNGIVASFPKIRMKWVVLAIAALVIFVGLFVFLLPLLGRSTDGKGFYYYLCIYIAAPLKNLDLSVNNPIKAPTYFGSYSFSTLYEALIKMNIVDSSTMQNLSSITEFRQINGYELGNVSTIFDSLQIDFGLIGSFMYMFFLGLFIQYFFEKAISANENRGVSFLSVFSVMLTSTLFLSFFSNMFDPNIFSTGLLKLLLPLAVFVLISKKSNTRRV